MKVVQKYYYYTYFKNPKNLGHYNYGLISLYSIHKIELRRTLKGIKQSPLQVTTLISTSFILGSLNFGGQFHLFINNFSTLWIIFLKRKVEKARREKRKKYQRIFILNDLSILEGFILLIQYKVYLFISLSSLMSIHMREIPILLFFFSFLSFYFLLFKYSVKFKFICWIIQNMYVYKHVTTRTFLLNILMIKQCVFCN